MQALSIANEALDSVLGNLKAALRISIPVLLLSLLLVALLGFDFWRAVFTGDEREITKIMQNGFGWLRVIILPVLILVISLYWVTVAWHRFVILDEQPGLLFPKFTPGRIWAYFWRLLVLGFVIGLLALAPLALLSSAIGGGGRINVANYSEALAIGPLAVVMNVIGTILFTYAFLRYSPFLVAAAIGAPIRAATGREATLWARGDIFALSVGYALITLISTFIGSGIQSGIWQFDLAVALALQWVAFMFTISLITTLYQKSTAEYPHTRQTPEEQAPGTP